MNKQITFDDINEHDLTRFRLEDEGRSYAINYTNDPIVDLYRRVYMAYPYNQRKGYEAIDLTIKTGVHLSHLEEAMKECGRRMTELSG
jgi:hypothetical protein